MGMAMGTATSGTTKCRHMVQTPRIPTHPCILLAITTPRFASLLYTPATKRIQISVYRGLHFWEQRMDLYELQVVVLAVLYEHS
ncbi:hypothetical protein M0804_011477 [Polistes exclamans]|nr:hypothetical protein M0804_011477 [Polistes exclamans]